VTEDPTTHPGIPGPYLRPDDVADAPDEVPPPATDEATDSPRPTFDSGVLLALAANLDAMRSQIDAALVVIDIILGADSGVGHPIELASSGETGDPDDCPHQRSRRQSLNTIGSGDDRPRWRCRDCGYIHEPEGD
jgi:hypothetical protein